MKWKILGKAILVVGGLFALITLFIVLLHYAPWAFLSLIFVSFVAWVYHQMEQEDYSDNDRIRWFSNDESEEEE